MSTTSSQSLSSALTVISANIEGLSAVKAYMISDLCTEQHCLCLQETLRAERPNDKYGSAIFIRNHLKLKSTDREHKQGGGIITLIKDDITSTSSSSSCHQTSVFHLSTHFFAVSLNLLRSSNEQGCTRRVHCIMCAVFSVA